MRRFLVVAASALLVSTPPALAHLLDPEETSASKDKVVCKERRPTGTRFARRTCRTLEQWETMSENAKRAASETVDRRMIETRRE